MVAVVLAIDGPFYRYIIVTTATQERAFVPTDNHAVPPNKSIGQNGSFQSIIVAVVMNGWIGE